MAEKKIGPINLEVTATSEGVDKTVARTKRQLNSQADAAKSANDALSQSAADAGKATESAQSKVAAAIRKSAKAADEGSPTLAPAVETEGLKDFDKKIGQTISSLYKLRSEAKKGAPISVDGGALTRQINKIVSTSTVFGDQQKRQLVKQAQLKADLAYEAGSLSQDNDALVASQVHRETMSRLMAERSPDAPDESAQAAAAEGAGDASSQVTGGKFGRIGSQVLARGVGERFLPRALLGNLGVQLGLVALAAAKAVAVVGATNRSAYERDIQDGRKPTAGDNFTNAVENVPLAGGLLKSLKTDMMDAFSGASLEADVLTKSQQAWLDLEEKRKAIKQQNVELERQIGAAAAHSALELAAIGDSTGIAGRSHQVDRQLQGVKIDAGVQRDSALDALNKQRSDYMVGFEAQTRPLKNLVASTDWDEVAARNVAGIALTPEQKAAVTAKQQLAGLENERKDFEQQQHDSKGLIGKNYDQTIDGSTKIAEKQKRIIQGIEPDLDGIHAATEEIGKSIRDLPIDDIDALRKAFAELHPDPQSIKDYEAELAKLKDAKKVIEGQSLAHSMDEQHADYGGMTGDEISHAKLIKGGLSEAQAYVKIWQAHQDATVAEAKQAVQELYGSLKNFGMTGDEIERSKLITGGLSRAEANRAIWMQHGSQTIASGKDLVQSASNGMAFQTDKEQVLSQLGLAGADGALIAKVKLALDTKEAGDEFKAWKQRIEQMDIQLKVEGAGTDERDRRHAGVDAEADKDLKGVTDPKLIAERRRQAEKEKKKGDQLDDAQQANQMTDDADTKVKYQKRLDEIQKLLKSGQISEDTARKQIGKVESDYNDANMPHAGPALLDYNSNLGSIQRIIASESGNAIDSSNPELTEAKKSNEILAAIQKGLSPQIANF